MSGAGLSSCLYRISEELDVAKTIVPHSEYAGVAGVGGDATCDQHTFMVNAMQSHSRVTDDVEPTPLAFALKARMGPPAVRGH